MTTINLTNPWSGAVVEIKAEDITEDRIEALAAMMDDDLRERLHDELAPCTPGEFFAAYAEADHEGASAIWFS